MLLRLCVCVGVGLPVCGRGHNGLLCSTFVGVGVGVSIVIVAAKKMPQNLGRFQGKKKCPVALGHGALGAGLLLYVLHLDRALCGGDHCDIVAGLECFLNHAT